MTITIQEAEKLRAENIRLREALKSAAEDLDDYSPLTGNSIQTPASRAARAALQGDTPPSPDVPAFDAWYQTRFAPIPPQTREYQMAKAAFAAGQASVKGGE